MYKTHRDKNNKINCLVSLEYFNKIPLNNNSFEPFETMKMHTTKQFIFVEQFLACLLGQCST